MTHDVECVDVSMFSETQHDMLWMRLRGDDIAYAFDGRDITVSSARAAALADAIAWVANEVSSPPPGFYPPVHPFERTVGTGMIVAARSRRFAAACIDRLLTGTVLLGLLALGLPAWASITLDAAYVIIATALWGRTVGKLLLEIRVVDASSLRHITWRQSMARWAAVGWISVAAGLIDGYGLLFLVAEVVIYAPVLFDAHGRGLHDHFAGTIVISTT